MNADVPETIQPGANSPEELSRLLEIELIQKRAEWQRASERNKNVKTLSLLFLFLVFMAGLGVFYYTFTKVNAERPHAPLEHGDH
jgi:hypothetical protein